MKKVLSKIERNEKFILNIELLRSNSLKESNLKREETNLPLFQFDSFEETEFFVSRFRITFDLSYLSLEQIQSPSLCLFPNLLQYINFATSLENDPACKLQDKGVRLKYLKPEVKSFAAYCSQKKGQPKNLSLLSLYKQGNPKMPLNVWINPFLKSLDLIREDSHFSEVIFLFSRRTKKDLNQKHLTHVEWKRFKLIVNSFKPINFEFSVQQWRFILSNTWGYYLMNSPKH